MPTRSGEEDKLGVPSEKGKGPERTGSREKGAALRFLRHPHTALHNCWDVSWFHSLDQQHLLPSQSCHLCTHFPNPQSQLEVSRSWTFSAPPGMRRDSVPSCRKHWEPPCYPSRPSKTSPAPPQVAKCPFPRAEVKSDWQTYPSSADGQFTGERIIKKKKDTSFKNS